MNLSWPTPRFYEWNVLPLWSPRANFPYPVSCVGPLNPDLLPCAITPAPSHIMWSKEFSNAVSVPILRATKEPERFHWKPALWQSVEFLVLEHTWRLAWDPYARYLLLHKPFWRDYLASADHFDMNRWGDGDDFLVNYIGHPLEGAVSGNIYLQNSPQGRSAKFGKSSTYWSSRFKAMAWSAVYSAYFEIGPVLSEAAIGNEGGYTYIPHCGMYLKCTPKPGVQYKPPTNNTGWVDFVVTPIVGTGWIILEDAIEAEIVDKLAKDSPALKYKIMRGALSPSRTMANFLAGKTPWYRFEREGLERVSQSGDNILMRPHPSWMNDPRWELGVQLESLALPMDWEGCSSCRVHLLGTSLTLGYRLSSYVSIESKASFFPGSGSNGNHGSVDEVVVGARVGRRIHSWGLYSHLRPGFIHYEKALVPASNAEYDSATRFALDLGGAIEYSLSRHSALRLDLGTTMVHYLSGRADPAQPPVSVLSDDYYTMQGSFHVSSGYVFRF